MSSHLTEIAEEIERIGHNANVTTRHLDYYSGGAGRNEDAEELAKYVLQHLTSIIDGLHIAAGKDAARYRWLRDHSCPPHNFYISVPDEFHGVRYAPEEVDAYIDNAIAILKEQDDAK